MAVYDSQFVNGIASDNPWWSGQPFPTTPEFKRSDYDHYVSELDQPKVRILLGPRRCGKTTLIRQIIKYLLDNGTNPRRILFVSLERTFYELHEQKLQTAISYFEEKILEKSLHNLQEMIYLFIDEAHYDNKWARLFKQYVDQNLPIYAIVSGSSAAVLYQDQESAAGRFHLHQMVTMKFRDVVRLRNQDQDDAIKTVSKKLRIALVNGLKDGTLDEYQLAINDLMRNTIITDALKTNLNEYLLKGGYPEFYTKEWKDISRHYQTNVFDVILQKDVVTIANIRQPQSLRTLLVVIAQNTARPLTREKLATTVGLQNTRTVDQYLDALAEAFLIRTSARFKTGKAGYPSTSPKKYYAADTGLRNAILAIEDVDASQEDRGAILETAIFNHCLRLLFHVDHQLRTQGNYWNEETEKDIVLDLRTVYNRAIPVEVKNGQCGEEDIKTMKTAIKKMNAPYGFIICKDQTGMKDNIMLLPAWAFLLSC